jgi:predicted transcriptional regulator
MLPSDSNALRNFSPGEWRVFFTLSMRHPLSVKQIGEEITREDPSFSQGISSLTTVLQRLMEKGYVRRLEPGDPSTPILYEPIVPFERAFRHRADLLISDLTQLQREQVELLHEIVTERLEKLPPSRKMRSVT